MQESRASTLSRGAIYYCTVMILLVSIGSLFQGPWRVPGIFFNQLVIFLGLALGFVLMGERRPVRTVFRLRGLTPAGWGKSLVLGGMVWALLVAMGALLVNLVELAGGKLPAMYTDLAQSSFALALLTRALLPAICEEMAFRGYLQWSLGPLGARRAVLLTALFFGAMHFSLIRLVPLVVLGWLFATAVQRSGSILPGMIMHFLNNAINLALAYFVKLPEGWSKSPLAVVLLVVAVVVLGVGAVALARRFGPGDARGGALEETSPEVEMPPLAPGKVVGLLAGPLIPAVLLYLYAVLGELYLTFWA